MRKLEKSSHHAIFAPIEVAVNHHIDRCTLILATDPIYKVVMR
jgi:hypothetical protein